MSPRPVWAGSFQQRIAEGFTTDEQFGAVSDGSDKCQFPASAGAVLEHAQHSNRKLDHRTCPIITNYPNCGAKQEIPKDMWSEAAPIGVWMRIRLGPR